MHKQVDDLVAVGLIKNSPDCQWVAPCHLVPKPRTDKWRLVIDYRYVNSLMQDDSYQMPRIDETLMNLKGFRYLFDDLNWGFWNVRIDKESQRFTGFAVPGRGTFIWCVVPFGLKVSPTNFQKAIEMALRDLIDAGKTRVYIDDIIIGTFTLSEHLIVLAELFAALRAGGFFINFEKAKFLKKTLLILGDQVAHNLLMPDPRPAGL